MIFTHIFIPLYCLMTYGIIGYVLYSTRLRFARFTTGDVAILILSPILFPILLVMIAFLSVTGRLK